MVDPALLLGAAVVKTACKIWLQDNAIAADATVGVVEIIQARVADARDQRRVRRLFEDLEERVADNVLAGMDVEFAAIPSNECAAAVLAVAETFEETRLTSKDLFAADLAAPTLLRQVRRLSARHTKDLSAGATSLYDRVLADCCAYVVEVADVLPGFQVGVFGELLARQHELLRLIDERFDRLPMQLGGVGAETFEPTYLRLVAKQLDKVELFGVTVSDRVGSYPLSVAYVSLSISGEVRHEEFAGLARPEQRARFIEDGLGGTRRAFIRGEAGSGKTTLLQWLAVRCARGELTGPMREWAGGVPLFIKLRRYAGGELPAPEEFLRDVGRNIMQTMPLGWVNHLLASGRAVVLIDGVDELPEIQRRRAREWLHNLLLTYPNARYVVTSRPAAAAESWLSSEGFDVLEIQPMTISDIDAFVSHWHAAMADGATDPKEIERLDVSRTELPKTIRTYRHLRMLAINPLMTALICALHLDRRMRLPNDRVELYTIALEMLLERRDNEREISSGLTISRADKVLILEDLAYWLVRNGWSNAPRGRVLERLAAKLSILHRVSGEPNEVLEHLLTRSGLLRMPVDGQVDFVHKTFQEFLAARAVVAADDIGILVNHAEDDQWREVILMAAAHGRATQTDELLSMLLERAERERDSGDIINTVAVGCIQHAPEIKPALREQVQRIAADLLPPKKMSQALALASVGDLALELLGKEKDYTAAEAAATIRMAAAIGGDQALTVISECARKRGRLVRDELERAWVKFEPRKFAKHVLADPQLSDSVHLSDPSLLAGLVYIKPSNLICEFAHGYGHVDYISDQSRLVYFVLRDNKLSDLRAVAGHATLHSFALQSGTGSVDIRPIGEANKLRSLDIPFGSISDPRHLSEISQIETLQFVDPAPMREILPALSEKLELKRFGLWDAANIETLEVFGQAQQLRGLNFLLLGKANDLTSIAGIRRWSSTMSGVYIHAAQQIDVSHLSALELLEFANLARTPVVSLNFAENLTKLTRLHIGDQSGFVPDLAPLKHLPELRDLHVWGTSLVDLSGLVGVEKLNVYIENGARRAIVGEDKLAASVCVSRSAVPRRRSI